MTGCGARPPQAASGGDLHDEVPPLGRDRVGLGDVGAGDPPRERRVVGRGEGLARFHAHRVAPHAQTLGLAPRLPGADVELPAVPGAGQDLAWTVVLDLARHARPRQPPGLALAQRAALVRAAVAQGEVLPAQVEDADRAPAHLDDLAP